MIEFKNITKYYKKKEILSNINLNIEMNKLICLYGKNGSGKTTLFKILSNYILPDKGEIFINNIKLHKYLKENIIYLITSDNRSFYYRLTLMQNLKFFASIFDKNLSDEQILKELEFVDLLNKKDDFFYELSTGMVQKLSFARAMLLKPQILILDELERGIDKESMDLIFKRIISLNSEMTILFSSHQDHIIEIANTKIFIENGIIVEKNKILLL